MTAESPREMLLVAHIGRADAPVAVRKAAEQFAASGVVLRVLEDEAAELGLADAKVVPAGPSAAEGCELVIVFGGDGTLLRAAEFGRASRTPLLGVNLGHVGFLAEAEPEDLTSVVARVLARDYSVEERMTIDVTVTVGDTPLTRGWALNEASVEKGSPERMLELVAEVDGRPLSTLGLRRRHLRDAHRVDRVRVLRRRPDRVARGGGPAARPDQRARLVLPADGGLAGLRPGRRGARQQRGVGRHVVRRTARRGAAAGRAGAGLPWRALGAAGAAADRAVHRPAGRKFDLPVRGWRAGRSDGGGA